MPTVTYTKRPLSDRVAGGASGTAELVYVGVATGAGSDDASQIRTDAEANLPASFDGRTARTVEVEPIDVGRGLYEVRATYRAASQQDTEPPAAGAAGEYEFETSTTSVHITQSKATVSSYVPAGVTTTPDFDEAIGVTEDGVDGCDILVPESRWSETHFIANASVTAAYRKTVRGLVGKTNNAAFRDHAIGEVLLVGVRGGKRRSDGVWQLTFRFAFSANATGLAVGPITGIAKGGWEYLWALYEPVVHADRVVLKPQVVYVERVYDAGDFSLLGIG